MSEFSASAVVLERIALEKGRLVDGAKLVTIGPAAARVEAMGGERFRALVERIAGDLDRLARKIERCGLDQTRLERLTELQKATDRALSESLALATGALAREFGLDAGRCVEADQFVALLAHRFDRTLARPTVPGEQEFLHRAVDVIRRRTPDYGLWDVPVMAHEFGHVVVNRLLHYDAVGDGLRQPVAELLADHSGKRRSRAEELFCDVFASWAVGPAYACSLVMHRLDPAAVAQPEVTDSHPSDAARVYACLWTLRRMNRGGPAAGWFALTIWRLETAWDAMQRGAAESARLTDDDKGTLNVELAAAVAIMERELSALRFPARNGVDDVLNALEVESRPPSDRDAIDLLNAAWVQRLEAWPSAAPAGRIASALASALSREGTRP